MSTLKLTTALLAGTILMTGLAAPALAYTPVSELKDVTPEHWAYGAIQQLVEKYEVMEGFPDRTFRGAKTLTRYELAAALAKVMARVEQMISSATGQPITMEPGVNPEDLRTIARLQREFRDELEVLKGRVDTLDTRVSGIEKRVRVGGEMIAEYRDFIGGSPIASAPLADMRLRNRLNLDASLADDLSYKGSLVWDIYGLKSLGDAFATNGPAGTPWTEMYVQRSYGAYKPGWASFYGGLVNVSDVVTLGATLKDPFKSNVWREGTGGFGFVGTPGLNTGSETLARVGAYDPANPQVGMNSVWWLPGTDVTLQSLDPNASQPIYPRSGLSAVASADAGPFNVSLAGYVPGVSGRDLSRLATLGYPSSFAAPETMQEGGRMLAAVGADFGVVRAQVAAKTPGNFATGLGDYNKTVTGTVEVGSDALGLKLEGVSHTAFTGNFTLDRASGLLASDNLFGTGFGLGLGLNAGTVMGSGLTGGLFTAAPGGRSLLQGPAGLDYASYGLMLRLPGFSILPSLTLAAQQTAGAGFGNTIASGLTLQTELQLFQLPRIQLEYNAGKFDPLGAGGSNDLLNQQALVSVEQIAATMVFPF